MSARKARRRPKASKDKRIQIWGGHLLTREQYDEYCQELTARDGQLEVSTEKARQLAVHNVLYRARPSVQAHNKLESLALWERATEASLGLGSLRAMRLNTADMKAVALYNAIIGHVAEEFLAVSQELAAMHAAIKVETLQGGAVITNVKPMSADHGRALAMAYELHTLLGQLYDRPENGAGSVMEQAWDHVDEAIHLLEPPDLEEKATPRSLRLAEERRARR